MMNKTGLAPMLLLALLGFPYEPCNANATFILSSAALVLNLNHMGELFGFVMNDIHGRLSKALDKPKVQLYQEYV